MGFNFPIIFWMIGFIILFIVIFGISIAASTMSKKPDIPKSSTYNYNQNYPKSDRQNPNPYKARVPVQENVDSQKQNDQPVSAEEINFVKFCKYCGAKVDRNAKFCYQCGSKL